MTIVADYRALLSGSYWYPGNVSAQPVVLSYSFSQTATPFLQESSPAAAATFQAFSESDKAATRAALAQWSQASGVIFIETTASQGDLTFGYYDLATLGASGSAGLGNYPTSGAYYDNGLLKTYSNQVPAAGDVYIDTSYMSDPFRQSDLPHVLVHEIGHALGLKHPFDAGAYTLDPTLDTGTNTVMSYTGARLATLGPFDVAAAQAIFGDFGTTSPYWSWSWDVTSETYTVHSTGDDQYVRGIGAASDVIYAPGLHDAVVTAQGNDIIYANGQPLSINAGAGTDTVYTGLTYAGLLGGVGGSGDFRYVYLSGDLQSYNGVETLVFTDGIYDTTTSSFSATPQSSVAIAAADAVQAEGSGAASAFTFTVTRSGVVTGAQTVGWQVSGSGGAPANAADFVGGVLPGGTVSFAAGQTSATLTVNVAGDGVVEPDEGFQVVLSAPSAGLAIGAATASGTILNDDSTLAIAATDAVKFEGNSGATPFTFTVTRAGSLAGVTTVRWAAGGLAPDTVGASDFAGGVVPTGTLTFAAGETSKTITVNIAGDTQAEPDEHFHVVLLTPSAGTQFTAVEAKATVLNDDTAFSIASTTGSHLEGNAGATPFVFTVTRSGNLAGSNSVEWMTIGALPNSVGPNDFVGATVPGGTLSFAPGEVTQRITVEIAGDTQLEPDEYFQVALRRPTGGAGLLNSTALAKVVNDETTFSLAATDAAKFEGNSGATPFTFTATRGGNAAGAYTVDWMVTGQLPNTAGTPDFMPGAPTSGTLTFAAGATTATITVSVRGDTYVEPDEHFQVALRNASGGATILANAAVGTILNDDPAPVPASAPVADSVGALTQVAAADFTGDGIADLLRQAPDGGLFVLDGASGAMSPVSGAVSAGAGLKFVAAADFNADGRADLLLRDAAGALYDWTMDGAAVRQTDLVAVLPPGGEVAQVADLTGDGRADILVRQSGSGGSSWLLLAMTDGGGAVATAMDRIPANVI